VKVVFSGVLSLDGLDIPAGLRHRLHRDHAFRDLDANLDGWRTSTAMRHGKHRLVERAERRLAIFQNDMGVG
jgi:hypothetical protein